MCKSGAGFYGKRARDEFFFFARFLVLRFRPFNDLRRRAFLD
jgi:hypothetical protein